MPKNATSAASEWQYEPSLSTRTASMSKVQTSFASGSPVATMNASTQSGGREGGGNGPHRTGSLKRALTSDEEEEHEQEFEDERRPLQQPRSQPQVHGKRPQAVSSKQGNNSNSSTSDYHSDENHPHLLPTEHRDLPSYRLQNFSTNPRSVIWGLEKFRISRTYLPLGNWCAGC